MPMPDSLDQHAPAAATSGPLAALDAWMASNPWHPRLVPFLAYIVWLPAIQWAGDWSVWTYPPLYIAQLALVAALLWRYRTLLPELTLKFHWLAAVVGAALFVVWVALGHLMIALSPAWFGPGEEAHLFERMDRGLFDVSLALRLMGMALLVPMFEELFIRSACLRGLHSPRKTWIGTVQVASDLPLIGDWLAETRYGRRIERYPPMFTRQLREWPVGRLSVFGVTASTLIFMAHHVPRDWAGCIACGVAWCALLWWTNRGPVKLGLGPVIWSHAITNALLWAWCVANGDWQFI